MFLGVGGIGVNCSSSPCTVTGTTNNVEEDSTQMNTPSHMNTDWNFQQLKFTLGSSDLLSGGSAVLTFLAWGSGDTFNEPPTVFLEGVNTTPTNVPEPASLSLLGFGLLGASRMLRRRVRRTAAA